MNRRTWMRNTVASVLTLLAIRKAKPEPSVEAIEKSKIRHKDVKVMGVQKVDGLLEGLDLSVIQRMAIKNRLLSAGYMEVGIVRR